MEPKVLEAIRLAAEELADETDGRQDAMKYVNDLVNDINTDCGLNYAEGSDSHGVLYKACHSAIWDATK